MNSIGRRWAGGGVPPAWGAVVLVGAGFIAAASVLLSYWASPAIVAGLLAGAVGVWAMQRSRVGALVLLLLSLPLFRLTLVQLGPVPISPVTALVLVLAGVWLWRVLTNQERVEPSWMQLPLGIFLLWGAIGFYGASDTRAAVITFLVFATGAVIYLVTAQTLRSVTEVRGVVWAIAVVTAAVGAYAIGAVLGLWEVPDLLTGARDAASGKQNSYYTTGGESYSRARGIFSHPNQLAGFLALAIPPVVALVISEPLRWRRVVGFLLMAVAITALVLTYSRGAWIGTGAVLVVMLLALRKIIPLVCGLALTGAFAAWGAVFERVQSVSTAQSDPAVTSRFEIWETALRMVAANPLQGVGLGNFETAYENLLVPGLQLIPGTSKVPNEAHNLFIHLTAEVGLVGMAAFVWLLAVAFLGVLRINRAAGPQVKPLNLGIAAGLVAVLIHNLVDVTIWQGNPFSVLLLFACLGALDAIRRRSDSGEDKHQGTPGTARA